MALRTRLKRINHRDMMFLLEQERDTAHSHLLFRSYLKWPSTEKVIFICKYKGKMVGAVT